MTPRLQSSENQIVVVGIYKPQCSFPACCMDGLTSSVWDSNNLVSSLDRKRNQRAVFIRSWRSTLQVMTDTVASENQPGLKRKYEKKSWRLIKLLSSYLGVRLTKVWHCTNKHNTIYYLKKKITAVTEVKTFFGYFSWGTALVGWVSIAGTNLNYNMISCRIAPHFKLDIDTPYPFQFRLIPRIARGVLIEGSC